MNDLSVSTSNINSPTPSAVLPEAPAKVSVRNLNFYYGEHHALKNISLTLGANRVTAFIGPEGAPHCLSSYRELCWAFCCKQRLHGQP